MKVNGSLVFDASSASEIQNLRVQKYGSFAAVPGWTSADAGRMVFAQDTGTLYYGTSSAWVAIATGGNAAALQTEVDAVETSLGSIVNSSGVWVVGQVTGGGLTGTETSLTQVLNAIAAYANANNTLAELDDVTLDAPATGDFLRYDGVTSMWKDAVITVADIPSITATAAELNKLAGTPAGLTSTELGFVDGVTSAIQDQLDNKQALDAGLTSLAALTGPGFVTVDASGNVVSARSLVAPSAGITITNTDGAGNPVFALANDLGALEGLSTTGYIVRTGDGTASTRAIAGTSGNIVVTNGDGVSSDTSLDLAAVAQGSVGTTFRKIALDGFGRVTNNAAVVSADITALVDAAYVNVSGDAMDSAANLTFAGGGTVKGIPLPTVDTDAANKAYVDAIQNGLSWKAAVVVATTGNIDLASAASGYDGVTLAAGDRVLVKDQSIPAQNGIYIFNGTGSALTRSADMDAAAEFDGSATFVQQGTVNQGTGWTETATVTTVGTSAVAFSQFSGGQAFIWGTGLEATGNTINVLLGSGIFEGPTDAVGLDLYNTTTGALILTTNGTTRESPLSLNGQLHLLLDLTAAGGLEQDAGGLRIKSNSVTNAMILNDSMITNGDTGTGSLALGGTLEVKGVSTQGIVTSVAGSVFTVTASDATTAAKGVASFASGDFDVTAGVVTIKALGVDNAQLTNSTFTVSGVDAVAAPSSDAVALGETLAIVGAAGSPVSTVVTANQVAISVRDATDTLKGVASFAAADFVVTAGAVTVIAKNLDSLTDVTISGTPAAGETLVANGSGQFLNKKVYHLETVAVAATSWSVTHNLGQKYCNVTVVDSTDEVVIPQSITFNSTTGLTVTFNTAITGKVVVMGIA